MNKNSTEHFVVALSSFLLFLGCPGNAPKTTLQFRIPSNTIGINRDSCNIELLVDNSILQSEDKNIVINNNDTTYWINYNLSNWVSKTGIFTISCLCPINNNRQFIFNDTIAINEYDWIIYSLYFGNQPEYGLTQKIDNKVMLSDCTSFNDTLFISIDCDSYLFH